jgi:hypothetical protein
MKRHSITAIIEKVQILTVDNAFTGKTNQILLIRKAAVNEIIRLNVEELPEIDMKKESEKFLESVKTICEDYNAKILNK